MADFYTNLPPKQKDDLDKTIEKLTTEGLIKINRSTQDVAINVEKAGL